jgi:hypothetical protein
MIFTHSGNSGDIIYSIPTINHLTNGEKRASVFIKPAKYVYGNQYDFVKDLLLMQIGIKEVLPFIPPDNNWAWHHWPGLKQDYDLDAARHERNRGVVHIIKRYFDAFNIQKDHREPFLFIDDNKKNAGKYALIHLTPRWSGPLYRWDEILSIAKKRHESVFFIGFQSEWLDFCVKYGWIEHIETESLLDMARLIRDCEALYCNQGVALTIAQGLGKKYYLVKNGNKTNCHLGTKNENIIGYEFLSGKQNINEPPDSHIQK